MKLFFWGKDETTLDNGPYHAPKIEDPTEIKKYEDVWRNEETRLPEDCYR